MAENLLQPFIPVGNGERGQAVFDLPPLVQARESQRTGQVENIAPSVKEMIPIPPIPEQSGNTLATVVAILSAGKGNFAPLFQLAEQKRRTQVFRQLAPILTQTQQLANEGKWEEASAYANQAFAKFGDRSPEIGQFLSQITAGLNKKQNDWRQAEAIYKMLSKGVPKEHPTRWAVDALGEAVKSKTPLSEQVLSQLMARIAPYVRQERGRYNIIDPLTGGNIQHPLSEEIQTADIAGFVADSLAKEFGTTVEESVNILRGEPVERMGQNITPLVREAFRGRVAQLQGARRDIELAKLVPTSAEYNEAMRQYLREKGSSDPQLDAASGNYNAKDAEHFRLSAQRFKIQQAEAPIQAQLNRSAFLAQQSGIGIINVNPDSPNFGQQVLGLTHEEVRRNPDLKYVRLSILDSRVTPAWLASNVTLDYIDRMFDQLDNPSDPLARLGTGVIRTLSSLTGVSLDPSITAAKAMELVANRAIEEVERTAKIDSSVVKELKGLTLGAFADAKQGHLITQVLKRRLNSEIAIYLGNLAISEEKIPEGAKMKHEVPPGTPTTSGGVIKVPRK